MKKKMNWGCGCDVNEILDLNRNTPLILWVEYENCLGDNRYMWHWRVTIKDEDNENSISYNIYNYKKEAMKDVPKVFEWLFNKGFENIKIEVDRLSKEEALEYARNVRSKKIEG